MSTNTVTISTGAQLLAAGRAAKPGDTILLAPGNYGDVVLSHINPAGLITIRSADPDNDAVFRTLRMTNVSNIHFDDFDVSRPLRAGESVNTQAMQVNNARNVTFTGLDLRGSMDDNALNDGHGISIVGGHDIAILDSTFEQLNTAVIVRSNDFLFAGNKVTWAQEGVSINSMTNGIFEKNYMANWQADYAAGDHPDMFQVHSGGAKSTASKNLIFRDNVMLPGADPVGGIFIRSEGVDRGVRHENILIENNFYEGAYRHAITVNNADDIIVRSNTVLKGDHQGLVPAINVGDIRGGLVESNISPMILEHSRLKNTDMVFRDNVDVWDEKTKKGIMLSELFPTRDANVINFNDLNAIEGATANPGRAGFVAVADIGGLSGSAAAQVAAWLPAFDQQFSVFH
jgi:hypothetical protein